MTRYFNRYRDYRFHTENFYLLVSCAFHTSGPDRFLNTASLQLAYHFSFPLSKLAAVNHFVRHEDRS